MLRQRRAFGIAPYLQAMRVVETGLLDQVVPLHAIDRVHVRVMRPDVVVDVILDRVEAWHTDFDARRADMDADGIVADVIYHGSQLIPGALDFVQRLQAAARQYAGDGGQQAVTGEMGV